MRFHHRRSDRDRSSLTDNQHMAIQYGTALQSYNSELMKCVDDLRTTRMNLQAQIDSEEEEKNRLQKEVERMTHRVAQLTENIGRKISARNDYDRTIQETESAYTKIMESSQLLLNMVKREANCLDQTLQAAEKGLTERA